MMKNLLHPGVVLGDVVMEPLALTVSDAADRLNMSRPALSRVLNGRAAISPEQALRLEAAGVSEARFWLNLQTNHDLAQARQRKREPVKAIQTSEAA